MRRILENIRRRLILSALLHVSFFYFKDISFLTTIFHFTPWVIHMNKFHYTNQVIYLELISSTLETQNRTEVIKFNTWASKLPKKLGKTQNSVCDPRGSKIDLGPVLTICIFNRLSGDATITGPGTTLNNHWWREVLSLDNANNIPFTANLELEDVTNTSYLCITPINLGPL